MPTAPTSMRSESVVRAWALLLVLGFTLTAAAATTAAAAVPARAAQAGPASTREPPYTAAPGTATLVEQLAIRPPVHTQPPRRLMQQLDADDSGAAGAGPATPPAAPAPTPRAGLLASAAAALIGVQAASTLLGGISDDWNYRIIGGTNAPPARYKVRGGWQRSQCAWSMVRGFSPLGTAVRSTGLCVQATMLDVAMQLPRSHPQYRCTPAAPCRVPPR